MAEGVKSDEIEKLKLEEAELMLELECRLKTVNEIRSLVSKLNEELKWHKLEQKWINHVPQVSEEMLRLILELNGDETADIDGILHPLLIRRSDLRAQVTKLRQMIKK